ncbi:MAG TPA: HlyD family type I secretion periplasmic adaptor subunit [Mesorhizobium sp.]|jgi:HlyD family secretion protein/epimerase transport system membrane fusion protein|uniref:HlyD family type I secretion periplasmic adaptor subunit n=1 Tax=Mesorhizobium sp. TaxID=1871066 RepID=UPI002DDDB782|nr:HlyD family type I secretion periplasmic adaptor subunit [Mesorhizobium sp.]HEV2504860.1 HlyD family type I secretion periplasmic adaptor subunit [Mesorhizobium sp.]
MAELQPGKSQALVRSSPNVIDGRVEPPRLQEVVRMPVRYGMALAYLFIVGGIAWSALAPMAEGATAAGIVSPDGSRRTVQHLEGGIIKELRVRDGDLVRAGEPLVTLQSTQAAALYDLYLEQARTLQATQARLSAEQEDKSEISFPADLLASADERARKIIAGQTLLFNQRRSSLEAQLQILDARKRQFEEQLLGLRAQVVSVDAQLALTEQEHSVKKSLVDKALLARSETLKLERSKAALDGDRGSFIGQIAEVEQKIGELDTQSMSLKATQSADIADQLEKARAGYIDAAERLNASKDVLDRTVITAPVTGKIANLKFKTSGGVIGPGQAILDIVPTNEQLLIDARVSPSDIDVVAAGLQATVHLTAYSSRGMPRVTGTVKSVSADRVTDETTGQSYYLARVEVPQSELEALDEDVVMMPGMPAEVLIVTGKRTVLAYLMEPFMAAFRRGLREV